MTINDMKKMLKNTNSIKIYKVKNGVGFHSYQFFDSELNKWCIGSFKSYSDAITLVFFAGFMKETEYTKFIIMERK